MASKKKSRKSKTGIILIVEGFSDQTVLEAYLECVLPNCVIKTHVYKGDLTCGLDKDGNIIPDYDPLETIESIVLKVMMGNGWQPQDVMKIIHVTDTDGAYVNDTYVKMDSSITGKTYCKDKELLSKNPTSTKTRNRYKRRYTLDLLGHSRLRNYGWDIAYELYYMSVNLEHVTQGSCELYSMEQKNDMAQKIRNRCFASEGYASELFSDSFLSGKSLAESWSFILDNGHSLERHTNLGLLASLSLS